MADQDPSNGSIDPLVQDYESRLQSLVMWDFESLPSLKSYLDNGQILLNAADPRFIELLRVDIRYRVQRSRPADDEPALAVLIQQFPNLSPALIRDLAVYEWQLRLKADHEPDIPVFVQKLKIRDDAECGELAELLAQFPVVSASRRETFVAGAAATQPQVGELHPGEKIGPYTVTEKIGHGGMGEVYKAQRLSPFRMDVALKVVRSGRQTQGILNRFDAERQALAMMEHPNIARVFDAGVTDLGLPYFAMEYVDGISVTTYCDKHRLSLTDRLTLFIQICRAIQHAHQKGIIHRDIKPGNVLVAMTDAGPSVRVIDFGLARAVQPELRLTDESLMTSPGQIVGTLRYMSPEQTGGINQVTDVRSDVYSLGIVLYELLTGSTPLNESSFKGQSIDKILAAIRNDDPPRPSARLNSTQSSASTISELRKTDTSRLTSILKGDLDWIVMKALEKEPNRRYESASHLAEDIERFLSGQPVVARPPSLTYRIGKTLRRHKVAAIVSATLVTAMLIVAIQTYRQMQADEQQRIAVAEGRAKVAYADAKATKVELEAERKIALQHTRTIEREKTLQSLLTNRNGPKSSEAQLTALNEAIAMEIMDDVDRVDLQLAKLDLLQETNRFRELRQLISEIRPLTPRQEGQLDLWKVRKAVSSPEQIELAKLLLKRKDKDLLSESDSRFLACFIAPSRAKAIALLESLLQDFPQHEPSRKMVMTLLLREGKSLELDKQIEQSRLLFPDSLDVEITASVAFALRGEQHQAEGQLQRLKTRGLITEDEEKGHRMLIEALLSVAEMLETTGVHSGKGVDEGTDFQLDEVQLLRLANSLPESNAVMKEVFGTAFDIGQPANTNADVRKNFLSGLILKITMASAARIVGNHTPKISLVADVEKLSPIQGDAVFLRTRSLLRLQPDNFVAALEELDPAVTAPCVFPKLRQQILYEAAMCHMGLYAKEKDDNHLKTAGNLASQWGDTSDSMPELQVVNFVKILQINGHYDDALRLIRKFRAKTPDTKNSLVGQELQVLKAAMRYGEVLELTDALLQSGDPKGLSEADIVSIRDDALRELSMLIESRSHEAVE